MTQNCIHEFETPGSCVTSHSAPSPRGMGPGASLRRGGLAATALLALLVSCASTPPVEDVISVASGAHRHDSSGSGALAEGAGNGGGASASIPGRPGDSVLAEQGPVPMNSDDPLAAPDPLPGREALRALAMTRLDAFDAACRERLETAQRDGATYDELMEASRALVFNADLRIQAHLAFRFDPAALPDPTALIDAEDDVPGDLKDQVRSLAKSSKQLADRALKLRPNDPAGRLFSTLGSGLSLWSMGPLQALMNGAATTLPKRIRSLAEDHPAFEGASPLRLKGRFQSRAPSPFKDRQGGVASLELAVEAAAIPLNLLFLGDACWLAGDREGAIAAWDRATRARADAETEAASPLLREIARLRVISARSTAP